MKITVFNSSPRKARGNTHVMVSAFLDGARDAGADATNIFLADKTIHPCTACYACWTRTPGRCVHNDDMTALLDAYLTSDLVVFATPLYVDNVTGIMKNFMDRLIATGDPHMELDAQGECRHVKRHDKPSGIAVISNCGFPEQSQFQVLRVLFARMARNLQCDLVAEIYRGAGGLLTSPLAELRPVVEKYGALLRIAGSEVVRNGTLSKETVTALEKPLIPLQANSAAYIAAVNRLWDSRLAETAGNRTTADVEIVAFDPSRHRDAVAALWKDVFAYATPRNEPYLVMAKKCLVNDGLFYVAAVDGVVVGTVMAGYDGHRGWIYAMAVAPEYRGRDIGSKLLSVAEQKLGEMGCMKINLQINGDNAAVVRFYEVNGYAVEDRISMGKELSDNIPSTTSRRSGP